MGSRDHLAGLVGDGDEEVMDFLEIEVRHFASRRTIELNEVDFRWLWKRWIYRYRYIVEGMTMVGLSSNIPTCQERRGGRLIDSGRLNCRQLSVAMKGYSKYSQALQPIKEIAFYGSFG